LGRQDGLDGLAISTNRRRLPAVDRSTGIGLDQVGARLVDTGEQQCGAEGPGSTTLRGGLHVIGDGSGEWFDRWGFSVRGAFFDGLVAGDLDETTAIGCVPGRRDGDPVVDAVDLADTVGIQQG
jgi:hypothetical protein